MTDIQKFFSERPAISVARIAAESGINPTVLARALRGDKPLPKKHLPKLIPILREYGYQEQ
jgi:DNA-binding IscR family transcriptional regulator